MRFLFVLFVILPIFEMWLLIEVGSQIGSLATIGAVLFTAVLGASLLKRQGLHTLTRAQQRLDSGQIPAKEILEGLMLAVSGALLLTPGFITDAIGFSLLVPGVRTLLTAQLLRQGVLRVQGAQFGQQGSHFSYQRYESRAQGDSESGEKVTIEGDFRRED
ncbi:FxsA family protein [Spongiibacter sp. KMU-158]|uniref:FxsA family protein n=1 Tax=Spongiibacter pelagi TaxID=2760804 RepID=A0A927GVI1_9GAMM|nr:FxsA family protein [Spongiibacter pelagi]MBD2858691.1 FxsA family protein [Spongiibacter pelagi]